MIAQQFSVQKNARAEHGLRNFQFRDGGIAPSTVKVRRYQNASRWGPFAERHRAWRPSAQARQKPAWPGTPSPAPARCDRKPPGYSSCFLPRSARFRQARRRRATARPGRFPSAWKTGEPEIPMTGNRRPARADILIFFILLFAVRGPLEVVRVARDVLLLPVAEGHFQYAHRLGCRGN